MRCCLLSPSPRCTAAAEATAGDAHTGHVPRRLKQTHKRTTTSHNTLAGARRTGPPPASDVPLGSSFPKSTRRKLKISTRLFPRLIISVLRPAGRRVQQADAVLALVTMEEGGAPDETLAAAAEDARAVTPPPGYEAEAAVTPQAAAEAPCEPPSDAVAAEAPPPSVDAPAPVAPTAEPAAPAAAAAAAVPPSKARGPA